MPMLTAADLLTPAGRINPKLFPADLSADLNTRLEHYLSHGYQKADAYEWDTEDERNEAAEAYAYYLAFTDIYLEMARSPASVTLNDQGSTTTLKDQIAAFKDIADGYLLTFDDLVEPATDFENWVPTRGVRGPHV
jgi:hypothetical protein